jgi:hypothetical protein
VLIHYAPPWLPGIQLGALSMMLAWLFAPKPAAKEPSAASA